jgi:hypothetical protein
MKHMIVSTPDVEKQLNDFKGEAGLTREIEKLIQAKFQAFSVIRIEAESGNGSSFLLHAIANEFRKEGSSFAFLHFEQVNNFEELTEYHISSVLTSPFVFIDNLHFIVENEAQKEKLGKFLQAFAAKNGILIYASRKLENLVTQDYFDAYFSEATLNVQLEPVTSSVRKVWASEKLNELTSEKIPEEIFLKESSNRDFLLTLKPYIDEFKFHQGTNFKELRLQEYQLKDLEMQRLKIKLSLLELNTLKYQALRDQGYEVAADLRYEQNKLNEKLSRIHEEMNAMQITPKPSEKAMRLFIYYASLKKQMDSDRDSFYSAIEWMQTEIENLQKELKEKNVDTDKSERLRITKQIVNWLDTLDKFHVMNTNARAK